VFILFKDKTKRGRRKKLSFIPVKLFPKLHLSTCRKTCAFGRELPGSIGEL